MKDLDVKILMLKVSVVVLPIVLILAYFFDWPILQHRASQAIFALAFIVAYLYTLIRNSRR